MERTLKELLKHITGATSITSKQIGQWLEWPPDAFAIASVFLEETGAYRHHRRDIG